MCLLEALISLFMFTSVIKRIHSSSGTIAHLHKHGHEKKKKLASFPLL